MKGCDPSCSKPIKASLHCTFYPSSNILLLFIFIIKMIVGFDYRQPDSVSPFGIRAWIRLLQHELGYDSSNTKLEFIFFSHLSSVSSHLTSPFRSHLSYILNFISPYHHTTSVNSILQLIHSL